jgi:integrase/recombinase XerD
MNDLTIPASMAEGFPTIVEGLKKARSIFESIRSFSDVERVFLLGAGLSPNTYRSYLESVKQFYRFTKGLNPLQVRPGDIEAFYDDLARRVDRNTAALRVCGLKAFFKGIRNVLPIYTSPFDVMNEKLSCKLSRVKKGNRTKKAMTAAELRALLAWLAEDRTARGLEDYAIVFTLATSGLRASELCQLRWQDLDFADGAWLCNFVGKGDTSAQQECYAPAVEACRRYFIMAKRRNPEPADALFWTIPALKGEQSAPLRYHALWRRVRQIGERARAAGILKRELQFSPHLMRRTYASTLYKSGLGLKAIQTKTRHANIEVLLKHYIDDAEPASPHLAKILAEVVA